MIYCNRIDVKYAVNYQDLIDWKSYLIVNCKIVFEYNAKLLKFSIHSFAIPLVKSNTNTYDVYAK